MSTFIWDFFRPILSERRGIAPAITASRVGTGGLNVGASATTTFVVPLPRRKVTVKSINIVATTAAAGSGAITAQVYKVSTADGAQAITSTLSLTSSIVTAAGTFAFPLSSGLADKKRLIDGGGDDYLRVDLVAAGTVTTQPQAQIVVEFGFCE